MSISGSPLASTVKATQVPSGCSFQEAVPLSNAMSNSSLISLT